MRPVRTKIWLAISAGFILLTGHVATSAEETSADQRWLAALKVYAKTCFPKIKSYEELLAQTLAAGWKKVGDEIDPNLAQTVSNFTTPRSFMSRGQKVEIKSLGYNAFVQEVDGVKLHAVLNRKWNSGQGTVNGCHVYDFEAREIGARSLYDGVFYSTLPVAADYLFQGFSLYESNNAKEAKEASAFTVRPKVDLGISGLHLTASGYAE